MITFGSNTRVYLAAGSTDMRKAVNGLMVLVSDVLEADPFSSHLVTTHPYPHKFVQKGPTV